MNIRPSAVIRQNYNEIAEQCRICRRKIILHDRKTNIKAMRRNVHNVCGEAQPFTDDTKGRRETYR